MRIQRNTDLTDVICVQALLFRRWVAWKSLISMALIWCVAANVFVNHDHGRRGMRAHGKIEEALQNLKKNSENCAAGIACSPARSTGDFSLTLLKKAL
jgi:hypothetical protein